MMECRKFEIILVSADNLPNIRRLGRMKVYAEVSLNGKSKTRKKTNVDKVGETNPRWNFMADYTISESSLREPGLGLEVVVKLYCERSVEDNKYIGEVKMPIKSLFDSGPRAENELSYDVAGTTGGRLNILYCFGNKFLGPKPSDWEEAAAGGIEVAGAIGSSLGESVGAILFS